MVTYRPQLWHLLVVAAIAVLDLAVLYMVLNPRVEADYYAYYIDRSASCFPRVSTHYYPLGEPATFVPGRNGYELDTLRWCGFTPPSATGIRSFGDYGILRLKFPDPKTDLLLTFSSWVNTDASKPKRDVKVLVNGEKVATITYASALRVDGKIIIPERLVTSGNGTMDIRFEVPRIAPPGTNSEPVTLQLRLEALRLVPLADAPPLIAPPATPAKNNEAGVIPPRRRIS